jgi:hypothetical protein
VGENPWREVSQSPADRPAEAAPAQQERPMGTGDISHGARIHRPVQVTSRPAGARVFIGETPGPVCETPCTIQAAAGSYSVRVSLAGYSDETREARVAAKGAEVDVALTLIRGNVLVEAPGQAALRVNGAAVANSLPVELSLIPGLYRITVDFGSVVRERTLNVRPGARLRADLRP